MAKGGSHILLWLGGGIAAWWLYKHSDMNGNAYLKHLQYSITSFSVAGNMVTLQLRIDNPNTHEIELRSVVGDVFANGIHVGRITNYYTGNAGLVIHGNDATILAMSVKLNTLDTITFLLSLLSKGKPVYEFRGTLNIDDSPIQMAVRYAG